MVQLNMDNSSHNSTFPLRAGATARATADLPM